LHIVGTGVKKNAGKNESTAHAPPKCFYRNKTSVVTENLNVLPREKMFLKGLKRCLAVLRDHAVLTARVNSVRELS